MREIKFKAYIKNLNWVVPVIIIDFEAKTIEVDLTSGQGDTTEYNFSEIELLQYTGLKDVNGIGIYEGDILNIEIKDKTIGNKIIAISNEVVEYKDCKFGVVWGWHRDFTGLDGFYNATFEVIGNVYEDPKLLQEGLNG
ncbi:hypothetical protein EXQ37_10970 [Clostridium botulinum]|nr:YopX family protein [Clostridium botulinum]MBO0560247.1 hypothetical protein [Clostridium botulinum]